MTYCVMHKYVPIALTSDFLFSTRPMLAPITATTRPVNGSFAGRQLDGRHCPHYSVAFTAGVLTHDGYRLASIDSSTPAPRLRPVLQIARGDLDALGSQRFGNNAPLRCVTPKGVAR